MAWTAPKTFGWEEATHTDLNNHIGSGGDTAWLHDRPACIALGDTQNAATSAFELIELAATEELDTASMHSTSSNTPRITIPSGQGGIYWVKAGIVWADVGATHQNSTIIRRNGSNTDLLAEHNVNSEGGAYSVIHHGCVWMGHLDAADYVEIVVWNQSGTTAGAILGTGRTDSARLEVFKVSD